MSYPDRIGYGLLAVTDQDIVAFGRGRNDSRETTIVALEWVSDFVVRWRWKSGRITILLHDSGGRYKTSLKFKGRSARSDVAQRLRLAALGGTDM